MQTEKIAQNMHKIAVWVESVHYFRNHEGLTNVRDLFWSFEHADLRMMLFFLPILVLTAWPFCVPEFRHRIHRWWSRRSSCILEEAVELVTLEGCLYLLVSEPSSWVYRVLFVATAASFMRATGCLFVHNRRSRR